jgi:hypothetical protein
MFHHLKNLVPDWWKERVHKVLVIHLRSRMHHSLSWHLYIESSSCTPLENQLTRERHSSADQSRSSAWLSFRLLALNYHSAELCWKSFANCAWASALAVYNLKLDIQSINPVSPAPRMFPREFSDQFSTRKRQYSALNSEKGMEGWDFP